MKLNELLGIEFPIIQGGMANIATGAFAAAVSNAGALGLVASGGMDAEALRAEIRAAKANTGKPFGVNLMLMNPHIDALAKVVAEEGVQVVTTGAGNPGKYVPAWKEAGIKVFPVVAAPILAKRLERYGIDGIIAEGCESGGHIGELTTMALVPQVVDAVSVPVIAAGVDFDLKTTMFTDPDGVLNLTEYTQPCMVAFAAGMTALLAERGIVPDYAAGLSLGEYSALQCAGVFTAPQAISLAAFRGKAMAAAAAGRPCGMTAVLGLDREKLQEACRQAAGAGVVEIANYNCPGQLVIGGEQAAVDQAAALAKELGAKRCLPLKVSGPFHTSLLAPAGDALREKFKETAFGAMRIPVLFNCLGREMGPEDTIPALLEKQVQTSVYMEDTIRRLAELGVDTIVEIGPGKALIGFVKKTAPAIKTYAVETCADLDALSAALKG